VAAGEAAIKQCPKESYARQNLQSEIHRANRWATVEELCCRENYFAEEVEDACDNARCWNRPTPRPPIPPASKPSKTNTGRLSRILIFFLGTFSPLEVAANRDCRS